MVRRFIPISGFGQMMMKVIEEEVHKKKDRLLGQGGWLGRSTEELLRKEQSKINFKPVSGFSLGLIESLVARQVYYLLLVQTVALTYLSRHQKIFGPGPVELLEGSFFHRHWGIRNLGLEGIDWQVIIDRELPWSYLIWLLNRELSGVDWSEVKGKDVFQELYRCFFPRQIRHGSGEYYTPFWLAEHVLDRVGYEGDARIKVMDPSCGSGVFILSALRRGNAKWGEPKVVGLDVNPLAVASAKVNYLLALPEDRADFKSEYTIPIFLLDVLGEQDDRYGDEKTMELLSPNSFELIVGNPPWVNWDSLSEQFRSALVEEWNRYGLFRHSGMEAILGKGKKDLSYLLTFKVADLFLKEGGILAFLITQTAFKSSGSADGFRAFTLPCGQTLRVLEVEDLSRVKPFVGVGNKTAIVYLKKGETTSYPVSYRWWKRTENGVKVLDWVAKPVAPGRETSPWLTCDRSCLPVLEKIFGVSSYRAYEGANTGGANGVYWIRILEVRDDGMLEIENMKEAGKKKVKGWRGCIEPDLVYPLLRYRDVRTWKAEPSSHIIMAQDPWKRKGFDRLIMSKNYPLTLSYLEVFKDELVKRAAFRRYFKDSDPFYSMFNIGPDTLAPVKAVWNRIGSRISAAVVMAGGKPVVPQETLCFVPCSSPDEAWYLVGLLNSTPIDLTVRSYSITGGKGFAGPHIFSFINFPFYRGLPEQKAVVRAAQKAFRNPHATAELNQAVAFLYGITPEELCLIERAAQDLS